MSRGLEVEIKILEKEFLKFKSEYETLEKEVKNKGLVVPIKTEGLNNFNYSIYEVSQTLLSVGTIVNSLKPISEVLGIKDIRPLTSGIIGIANGLNMVKTASNAVSASLGWLSIATTALSTIINLLYKTKNEIKELSAIKNIVNFRESIEQSRVLEKKLTDIQAEIKKIDDRGGMQYFTQKKYNKLKEEELKLELEISKQKQMQQDYTNLLKVEESKKNEKGANSKEGISEASQVYADFTNLFKDLETQFKVGLITFEEYNKTSSEKVLELQQLINENFNDFNEENKKFAEQALGAGEKALNDTTKILEESTKKAVEFAELMINSFNDLGAGIINSLDSFVNGDLDEGVMNLTDGIMKAGFGIAGDVAKGIAGPIGEVGVKAVQAVWDFFVSLFMWWKNNEKKNREAEEKKRKEEFEKKKKADAEALKEKREAEKELLKKETKIRQDNIKQLEKDLDIFENAFSRGAIGLAQYIQEIEENLKKKQAEQEAIESGKAKDKERDKEFKKNIENVNNRQFSSPTPQNANLYKAPQNSISSYNDNNTTMNNNSNIKIENININATIDPNNKNSLKELSIQILEEFKKLKIQGKFEGV